MLQQHVAVARRGFAGVQRGEVLVCDVVDVVAWSRALPAHSCRRARPRPRVDSSIACLGPARRAGVAAPGSARRRTRPRAGVADRLGRRSPAPRRRRGLGRVSSRRGLGCAASARCLVSAPDALQPATGSERRRGPGPRERGPLPARIRRGLRSRRHGGFLAIGDPPVCDSRPRSRAGPPLYLFSMMLWVSVVDVVVLLFMILLLL